MSREVEEEVWFLSSPVTLVPVLVNPKRSPQSSSRRSSRRHKNYISEREDFIRRRKEAYMRQREKYRRDYERPHSRHRSRSRSRSSSSRSSSLKSHESGRSRGRRRSGSRSRARDYRRRDRSGERDDSRHHRPGPSSIPGMAPYPGAPWGSRPPFRSGDSRHHRPGPSSIPGMAPYPGAPWGSRPPFRSGDSRHHRPGPSSIPGMAPYPGVPWGSRPPFRHLYMPGPPIPFYPAPMIYAAPPPFRPFPPAFRGPNLSESVMSSSTSDSEDNGRVEKGPTGELKKTIPNKTSATEELTSLKDDEKTTFRGPDGGAKLFTKNEFKKLQIHIEIKKPEAASTPPAVPFDPNLIAPVRRPEHDFEYDRAKRAGDIRRADRKAILGFAADAITNGSPAALVGAVGISAKYAVESLTGVLYPPSLNKFIKKQGLSIKEIRAEHRRWTQSRTRERAKTIWQNR
ncbi:hypothetical protein GE061_016966 [Apolygus lucorum]|uniref:Uncharacterized protein n=1 Tax=Apolygus lucorum TaxID=248454 RepID=A0A8S9XJR8_APOLU|nr:hypothetical protein GE061_016966 [Apolygus lucorum]